MPPRKRKSNPVEEEENTTDDEKQQVLSAPVSKKGRQINPSLAGFLNIKPKLKHDLEWCNHGEVIKDIPPLYYLYSKTLPGCKKIAAFDIDNTIIVTKSGKNFATNSSDWKWFDQQKVPSKLKELNDDGYRVVFITNQAGIEKKKTSFAELKTKFEDMLVQLDIPIFIFVATGETHFRKPSIEMWNFLIKNCNKSETVDMKESFYVGDAAGRPKNWAPGKSKDFSCGDRMFAHNLGIKFQTPEEFFLNQKSVGFEWGSIDPLEVLSKHEKKTKVENKKYHSDNQELVLLVGPPASGKTTFSKRYLIPHNYVHINRDTLSTQSACLKGAEKALKEGKSVVIDNTNPSKKNRQEYIKLGTQYKLKQIRCFKMNTPIDLCHHLNYVRQNYTNGKIRRIPDVGYNMYKSQYEDIDQTEGFNEIISIDFVPVFDDDQHETVFKQRTN